MATTWEITLSQLAELIDSENKKYMNFEKASWKPFTTTCEEIFANTFVPYCLQSRKNVSHNYSESKKPTLKEYLQLGQLFQKEYHKK